MWLGCSPSSRPSADREPLLCREELPTIYKCPYQGCTAVYRGADGMKVSSGFVPSSKLPASGSAAVLRMSSAVSCEIPSAALAPKPIPAFSHEAVLVHEAARMGVLLIVGSQFFSLEKTQPRSVPVDQQLEALSFLFRNTSKSIMKKFGRGPVLIQAATRCS